MAAGANPIFRRYTGSNNTSGTFSLCGSLVAASRVLIVSKFVICNTQNAATSFSYQIATSATGSTNDIGSYFTPLGPGESFTETGILIPAGYGLYFRPETAAMLSCQLYGEEVDAS